MGQKKYNRKRVGGLVHDMVDKVVATPIDRLIYKLLPMNVCIPAEQVIENKLDQSFKLRPAWNGKSVTWISTSDPF